MAENKLVMRFIDEGESFCNGFECGRIDQMMSENKSLSKYLIHADNIPQIKLICIRYGYRYSFEKGDEQWAYLIAQPDLTKNN